MGEITKSDQPEINAEDEPQEIAELSDLPESVRVLFAKLPDSIKTKILPQIEKNKSENSPGNEERSLDEMVASFDVETRERYMGICLARLFADGRLEESLESLDANNLKIETNSLLDLLWNNRGKRDNVDIFNQKYYEDFSKGREPIISKIKPKNEEIGKLIASIAKTKKQKRLTEMKTKQLEGLETERDLIYKELEEYDERYDHNPNYKYSTLRAVWRIEERQKKEKDWTKAAAATSEYLDPAELATLMAEQFHNITFYHEFHTARNPKEMRFGRPVPESEIMRCREVVDSVDEAIKSWYGVHENDGSFKKPKEAKLEERQTKLIDYFISLMNSYRREKEAGREDSETVCVRQMEVALSILGK